MKPLFVKFYVEVKSDSYVWSDKLKGMATIEATLPVEVLGSINAGEMFQYVFNAAIDDFNAKMAEADEETEED